MSELTADRLRELLSYDPETGVFRWRVRPSPYMAILAGDEAGCFDGYGYRVIRIARFGYKAHRLAWLYMSGAWPRDQIDHLNGDKADNRWVNLREAGVSGNQANRPVCATNKSGFKGVFFLERASLRPWRAAVRIGGKTRYLGRFSAREEAALVYATAACGIHGEFARPKWQDVLADIRGVRGS
jgi:HNH endonuclease